MGMVGDEPPCVTGGLGLGKELSQAVQHILLILIIYEYLSTLYPPDHDVVQDTGRVQASLSWHANSLTHNSTFHQLTFLPALLPRPSYHT